MVDSHKHNVGDNNSKNMQNCIAFIFVLRFTFYILDYTSQYSQLHTEGPLLVVLDGDLAVLGIEPVLLHAKHLLQPSEELFL